MGLSLFRAFLVINVFSIGTENPITPKPYRFSVYPVNKCPGSKTEFQRASQRMNCTKDLRYLCAPNKYLSSLIEFCTDRKRSLYGKGNCVVLEGTGDLDHYRCVEKFNRSCPSTPYYDEEIYKFYYEVYVNMHWTDPACLEIDKELRCFSAENGCNKREFLTTETHLNISEMETIGNETNLNISNMETFGNETFRGDSHGLLAIGYIIAIAVVLTVIILIWMIFQKRKKEQVEKSKDNYENETLLKDNQEIDDDKLRQFLSKGEITVCHVRCIIVGCAEAGKTTLLKRLQNVSFDKLVPMERTKMVDFHVNSFEVLLEEETIQSVGEEDTVPTILFSKENLEMPLKENDGKMAEKAHQPSIRKKKVSEKSSLKNTTLCQIENIPMDILNNQTNNDNAEDEKNNIFEPHSQDTTLVQNPLFPEPNEKHGEDIDAIVDQNDFEQYAILKIKDDVNELLNETNLRPRITFLDFAGQSMYYAFHQIFLRPKSCSILVVDMTKSLDDKVCVQDENEKECSQFASWRYRDYYKFWLRSIDVFSDTESPVIIVGTHADKLSKEECRNFRESLLIFFDSWCHSDIQRHVNADRIHTIGFPDLGSELEDLKDLKKCIANIVKSPRYSKENIRPVWAFFEHILNKMKENKKVISRKTLSDYIDQLTAQEFRINESEISKMLDFFHRVGVLLYFDKDGLKENIILDIQWLLDAFKCIIEYHVRPEENDKKRRQFYHTGKLDNVELNRIWNVEGKHFLEHKTTIIAYMQQLGLLMPLKELHPTDSSGYYFPSMNSKRFDKTGENNTKSSILCFKFDDEMQLPINVFHGIVLKCSKLNNWSILTEGTKKNICLYQNAACFSFQKHVVVLCNCNFEIRVQVWALPEIYDGRLLKEIKHSVKVIINDDDRLSCKIGYKCRKDVLNVEEDVSFISHTTVPVPGYLCETCDVDKKHEVDNDICWDPEVNGENQGVKEEDTVPKKMFSKEILEMPFKENGGKVAEEAHQPIKQDGKQDEENTDKYAGADDTLNTTKTSIPRLLKIGENVDSRDQDGGTPLLNACLYSPLMTACQEGDDKIVQILLDNKADINARDNRGENSLWKACACGHESTVNILISNGADVNFSSKDGCAPLHIACENGHLNLAQLLIDNGADINLCDKDGCNALFYASTNGHGIIVELLLKNEADVNSILKDGTSALMIACENGFESITQTLLEKGAYINWRNDRGYSPLIVACQKARDRVVRVLLERQADVNLCNKKRSSALYKACQEGHNSTIDILLSYGADVNLCRNDGSSPLHIACECGWYNTVKLLLRYENVNINLCDNDGCNALIYACQNGHDKIVELLLNHHLDVNSCSTAGKSSLHFACENGKFNTAQLLLNKKADIRLCDNDGRNALIFACQNGYHKIAQLLLKHGADINVCSKNGCSVLYLTCEKEQLSTVEFLMKKGADVNICNKDGYSPLEFASKEGYDNVIQLFIEAGADINFCSENGTRPIHEACSSGQKTTVDLLLRNGVDVNLLDSKGFSALSYACIQGNETIAFVLLKNNANVNLCSNYETTPLLLASFEGLESIIQLLLKYNADVNLCSKDGSSPLLIACLNENAKTAEILLENGANVNQSNKRGYTPLIVACQEGNEIIVQLLLNKMADINLCNENGASPLYKACQQGHHDVINILLSKGADVNLCRKDGLGPLHIASINKHVSLVELLLKKGADINLCDKEGYPAFAYASEKGYESIQQLLLEYGADMYSFTANHTPSNITRQDSTLEILDNDDMDIILCYDTNNSPI